ncbi:penicillin-binding protein [Streptomyces sp. AV19]|uniref:penicillin-binding transpeptidase domain-containing protein n=1 Tax=Streptomyces sp. AV19 TaxID=2793068 RepID=UPI0018FEDB86|nr:penicillin-binding transpeptidase domain-containing protein [Streptomyces sp. AV19]MBH1935377.1 penicillin-binding protein [Streptomyces sp. AV19]MDG4531263.1 penicillin-binding transpeptidase domain-containing protein [Streptomyces sp. AV19]
MRTGAKVTVGVIAAALLGGAGFGAYRLVDDVGSGVSREARPERTGPPTADEVERTARDFLAAWAKGDAEGAAALTDNAQAASAALGGYREGAGITKVTFRQGAAAGPKVPFTVTAEVAFKDRRSTWTYESSLGVVRGRTTGRAVVDWQPAVLHPKLAPGETLRTGPGGTSGLKAVDRAGRELNAGEFPSLAAVLPDLRKRFGQRAGGRQAVEVRAERADGTGPGRTLHVIDKGEPAVLRTTLDARAQRAAEDAVARRDEASVVALRPSTGEILAVADTGARRAGFNAALLGRTAPGSTMKVVTAALLLEKGAARTNEPLPCPRYATYGKQFHNVEKSENAGATFAQDFAASCNTAFVSLAGKVTDADLGAEARDVFGLGMDWQAGVTTFDGRVPDGSGAEKAAAMIGQGQVQMNPLTMASVSATVKDGTFRQPHLVDPEVAGLKLARAARPLPGPVADGLRRMMRLTALGGTGRTAMAGLGGDVGAKTGSAEVDGQERPNGWFTAYRGDMAAAAVIPRGGHGGDSAGPVVAAVLRTG